MCPPTFLFKRIRPAMLLEPGEAQFHNHMRRQPGLCHRIGGELD